MLLFAHSFGGGYSVVGDSYFSESDMVMWACMDTGIGMSVGLVASHRKTRVTRRRNERTEPRIQEFRGGRNGEPPGGGMYSSSCALTRAYPMGGYSEG